MKLNFKESENVEFVAFIDGIEREWVNPILTFEETDAYVEINNGYDNYKYIKHNNNIHDWLNTETGYKYEYNSWKLRRNIADPVWKDIIISK